MSETENCRFVRGIGESAMRIAIVPAILVVLIIASGPATGEVMNLGTAQFAGFTRTSASEEGVELWFEGWSVATRLFRVSWHAGLDDIGDTLYVSAETGYDFEIVASVLSNGINNEISFVWEDGTECISFIKSPGIGSQYCDFYGYDITAVSLTIHSLTVDNGNCVYDVTVAIWGQKLVPATIYYVDANANGLNDGSSWADAYKFLQDALANADSSAKPVEIRVAQGSYTPDSSYDVPGGTGDREATFRLLNRVIIKGGYAGLGEPEPNARDVELYQTVLTGDLIGDDGQAFANNGENSYSVVTGSSTDPTAVLDGFVITGGNADVDDGDIEGSAFSSGGGMFSIAGSPTVRNCTFEWNWVQWSGGGMCNYMNSHPTIINCMFRYGLAGQSGGGMRNHTNSNPTLTNCTFSKNSASVGAGGMSNQNECNPTVNNCTFSGNTSGLFGGGMTITSSYPGMASTLVANCTFIGNKAGDGSGIRMSSSHAALVNCTFIGNRAESGGGAISSYNDHATLTNCIIYGNTQEGGYPPITGNPTVLYSNVQGGWPGEGNIDADPCFADPGYWHLGRDPDDPSDDLWVDGDYHLKSEAGRWGANEGRWIKDDVTSPCVDAGDPNSDWTAELWPHGGRINIGAYGGTSQTSMSPSTFGNPADFNCDGTVDAEDLLMLAEMWSTEALLLKEDINRDGLINFPDFAEFADNWLWVICGRCK